MGLADAIVAARPAVEPKCTVCRVRRLLSAEDQAALDAAIANDKVSDAQVAAGLRAEGYHMTDAPVGRHRRGACANGSR